MPATNAFSADRQTPPMASGFPDFAASCQPENVGICGHAKTIKQTQRGAAMPLLALQRERLMVEAERLRNMRRNKDASICEQRLRAVNCAILAMGPK